MTALALLRATAILRWFIAVGFGVFCFPAIRNLLIGRPIPIVMGFPAYGRGRLERVGIATTIPLWWLHRLSAVGLPPRPATIPPFVHSTTFPNRE
jgi:hypothetical protein